MFSRLFIPSVVGAVIGLGGTVTLVRCTPAQSPPIVNELLEAGIPQDLAQQIAIVLSDMLAGKPEAQIIADVAATLPDNFVGSAEQVVLDIVTMLIDTGTLDKPQNAQAKPRASAILAAHARR